MTAAEADTILLFTAFSTAVLAVFTVVLAYYTFRLWTEQKRMRSPEVVASFESDEEHQGLINYVVQNIGGGSAHNINVTFEEDPIVIQNDADIRIQDISFNRLSFLKPDQKIYRRLNRIEKFRQSLLKVVVKYEDRYRKKYTGKFEYNLENYRHSAAHVPLIKQIATSLNVIANNTKKT